MFGPDRPAHWNPLNHTLNHRSYPCLAFGEKGQRGPVTGRETHGSVGACYCSLVAAALLAVSSS